MRPDYAIHNHAVGIYEVIGDQILGVRAYEDTAMLNYVFASVNPAGEDDPFLHLTST